MKRLHLFFFFTLLSLISQAQDSLQRIRPGRRNAAANFNKPYVILISIDGYRHDYSTKYSASNLLGLSKDGIRAEYLQSTSPSLTFVNHYGIATGMYPGNHGIVDNDFYDPAKKAFYDPGDKATVRDSSWYGGVPIWSLAEQQGMLSASYFWIASESNTNGTGPTYYYHYTSKTPLEQRITTVKHWLQLPKAQRPHLITFYINPVDHAGHHYGPESKQAAEAVQQVDAQIGSLVAQLDELQLPINYIVLSDHGMTTVDTLAKMPMPPQIDTNAFYIPPGNASLHLYAKDPGKIKSTYRALRRTATGFTPYLKKRLPKRYHHQPGQPYWNRVGDIVLLAEYQRIFHIEPGEKVTIGKHGFDPEMPDMRGIFYAWGPAFRTGISIPPFENIHVYPLIAAILGLDIHHRIDGRLQVLRPILQDH